LASTVDRLPLPDIAAMRELGNRDAMKGLGWFASPSDICRVYAALAELSGRPGLSPIGQVLSINDDILELDPPQWHTTWRKGVAGPRALGLAYLATTQTGQSYVVTVLVENRSEPIDGNTAGPVIHVLGDQGRIHARCTTLMADMPPRRQYAGWVRRTARLDCWVACVAARAHARPREPLAPLRSPATGGRERAARARIVHWLSSRRADRAADSVGRCEGGRQQRNLVARRLRKHGYQLVSDPEGFIVNDAYGVPRAGEVERAMQWGAQLVGASVSPQSDLLG
jgi:hypothetical protein